jgi:hypothetical protein
MAMPILKTPALVKKDVAEMIEDGEILLGVVVKDDSLNDAIVDGELVKKELVATVHVENPEDVTLQELKEAFPEQAILHRAGKIRLVFKSREDLERFPKAAKVGEQVARVAPFKEDTVKGIVSSLKKVIQGILENELPATKFIPGSFPYLNLQKRRHVNVILFQIGQVYDVKLLIWVDAKYTYTEKSFVKVALMGAPFRKHRTKIARWADIFGHESELLNPNITALLNVEPFYLFDLLSSLLNKILTCSSSLE